MALFRAVHDKKPNLTPDEMNQYMYTFGMKGNIIDHTWYKIIKWKHTKKNTEGKPHREAIELLADVVYWYRPKVEKDEAGNIVLKKKFRADILQKSYKQIEEALGLTKREATTAFATLEGLGILKREFRTVTTSDHLKISNVLFIRFYPEKLYELTQLHFKKSCMLSRSNVIAPPPPIPPPSHVQTCDIYRDYNKEFSNIKDIEIEVKTSIPLVDKKIADTKKTEKPQKTTAKKPKPPNIQFDQEQRCFTGISQRDKEEWRKLYSKVDIEREISKAVQWCLSNPAKVSQRKLWRKFLTTWFSNADNDSNFKKYKTPTKGTKWTSSNKTKKSFSGKGTEERQSATLVCLEDVLKR